MRHAGLPLEHAIVDQLVAAFATSRKGDRLSYADFHRMVHCHDLTMGAGGLEVGVADDNGAIGGLAGREGSLEEQVPTSRITLGC